MAKSFELRIVSPDLVNDIKQVITVKPQLFNYCEVINKSSG